MQYIWKSVSGYFFRNFWISVLSKFFFCDLSLVSLALSVRRSKVRNVGIEIYHITSSEKFQGHWKWLQGRSSLYSTFHFEKCNWLEGEAATAVVAGNFTRRTGIFLIICLRLENFESECRIIAVKGQIELRECLLLLGAQYFVFILLSKNINFKVHRNVFFLLVCTWVNLVSDT